MRRLAILVTAAVVTLGACSSGGSEDQESAPAPTAEAEGAEEGTRTLADEAPAPTSTPTPVQLESGEITRDVPEEGNTTETFGPLGETDAEFETEDGTLQIGSGDVPEVAAAFPVPEDLDVQLANETQTDVGFSGVTAMEFAELIAFYEEGLPAAGFEILSADVTDDVFAVFTFESETQVGQVAISQAPGFDGWTVLVNLGDGVGDEEQLPDVTDGEADDQSEVDG